MSRKLLISLLLLAIASATLGIFWHAENALAQTTPKSPSDAPLQTGFTYQGYLVQSGVPVTDDCDFQFGLWDASSSGTRLGALQEEASMEVANGRFSVVLNTGDEIIGDPFTGRDRYLEVGVRCPVGNGAYTILTPRQYLTAAPYAHSLRPGAIISGTVDENMAAINLGSNRDGLRVFAAAGDGIYVDAAGGHGLSVSSPDDDALFIRAATNGIRMNQLTDDAIFVEGAQENGFHIELAGSNGLQVDSFGNHGIQVQGKLTTSMGYGGFIQNGLFLQGGCTGCDMRAMAVNRSSDVLNAGDLVAIAGMESANLEGVDQLMQVRLASNGDTVVGVVVGSAEIMPHNESEQTLGTRNGGSAGKGEYVSIMIYGVTQVQVEASTRSTIQAGDRLTLAATNQVRGLQTVEINGVKLAEDAPTLGIALDSADSDGNIWVLVNPR
ncbi:MAG: hypothetical protein ACPG8W_22645 [Candidatus Promineifilaceae bacterium]